MKKLLLLLTVAVIAAVTISFVWQAAPYEEQLIQLQIEQELGCYAEGFKKEPVDIQALALDYSDDEELILKTKIALAKYSEKTRQVLLLFGSEPEYKESFLKYGESIVPVIHYFVENEMISLEIMNKTRRIVSNVWSWISGEEKDDESEQKELSPEMRGWLAVNYIKEEGHDLLGQFVVDEDGNVKRIQTERVVEVIGSFFTSGIRTLETKYTLGEDITQEDVLWAAVEVAVMAGTLKLLRASRAVARSGKQLSLATRTRIFGARLLSKGGRVALQVAKYGVVATTAYLVIRHPSLLHSVFAEVAERFGLNPWLVQLIGWSPILLVLLYPLSWLFTFLIRPTIWLLNLIVSGLKKAMPENRNIPDHRAVV